jgi:hypothetical protein
VSTLPIAPASLHLLRRCLESEGVDVAAVLTPAAAATGHALTGRWGALVRSRGRLDDPSHLDVRWFGPLLRELLAGEGWGTLDAADLGGTAVLLESFDWAEAEPGSTASPACHFTVGMLEAFLGDLGGEPLSVLEVDCRSAGGDSCAFLASSPEVIEAAVDLLAAGGSWREAVDPVTTG